MHMDGGVEFIDCGRGVICLRRFICANFLHLRMWGTETFIRAFGWSRLLVCITDEDRPSGSDCLFEQCAV